MRSFLRFIVKHQFVLLFVLLMFISLSMVVRNNNYQRAQYNDWSYTLNGRISLKKVQVLQYLSLQKSNNYLALENAKLKNEIEHIKSVTGYTSEPVPVPDGRVAKYSYITAKVLNNSVNKQYNYIIIDKGKKHGIKPDMAVISPDGIVGIVESVSENYASVISALNRNFKVSAKFKKNNYFGSFEWPGINYRTGAFNEIPLHVNVSAGDTIVTSGFSAIFPEGVLIGYVNEFEAKGGNFFKIRLQLSTDFKNLNYVYIVNNNQKEDFEEIENMVKHD